MYKKQLMNYKVNVYSNDLQIIPLHLLN